jgi:hypothetical protein
MSSEGRNAFAPAANRTSATDSHVGRNIGETQGRTFTKMWRPIGFVRLRPLLYDFSKPRALTVPQQPPALFTTGKLVAECSWSFRRASSTGSSAPQHADEGRMISSTRTSEGRRSSAATPQHTSRSVTTPTSLRVLVSSTTGAQPQPESRIARAARATVSSGEQHEDASIVFITSLQQLIFSSFFNL